MKLEPFDVEIWLDEHENDATCNIAESCCAPYSISELLSLSSEPLDPISLLDLNRKQGYGEPRGLPALRSTISALYSVKSSSLLSAENILITSGGISANYISLATLVGPGDHVICHYPTYQQLFAVPKALGAEVDLWHARPEAKWIPDIEQLKQLIKPNTKLIVLNNPQSPTGAVIPKNVLEEAIELAAEKGIVILSDEVYRPIFHGIGPVDSTFPPSVLSVKYDNVIATGSMSKAYSLAGIRVGWVASRSRELIDRVASTRHYTTLSVSQLDQQVAAFALSQYVIHNLIMRNIELARKNLDILQRFITSHKECEWVKPVAGTTAFIKFSRDGKPVDDVQFCEKLLKSAGVLLVPGGKCFGREFKGYVRLGFVAETSAIQEGLAKLDTFLSTEFQDIPTD